ncbi:hypothetical protein ACFL35_21850, partial [Candidatus Riflebacteria bacterium]
MNCRTRIFILFGFLLSAFALHANEKNFSGRWQDYHGKKYIFNWNLKNQSYDMYELNSSSGKKLKAKIYSSEEGEFFSIKIIDHPSGQVKFGKLNILSNYSLFIRVGLDDPIFFYRLPQNQENSILSATLTLQAAYIGTVYEHLQKRPEPDLIFWLKKSWIPLLSVLLEKPESIKDIDYILETESLLLSCPNLLPFINFSKRFNNQLKKISPERNQVLHRIFIIWRAVIYMELLFYEFILGEKEKIENFKKLLKKIKEMEKIL